MRAHQVRSYVLLVSNDDPTTEPATGRPEPDLRRIQEYEIRVSGHLGSRWATWFDGLTVTLQDDGTTVISGPVVDQSALHGQLQKLRDLGITLLSLTPLEARTSSTSAEQPDLPHHDRPTTPGATS